MTKFDVYKKKTYTNYWNHFSSIPKISKSFTIIRKIKFFIKKIFPYSIKIKNRKKNNNLYEMFSSFQIDKEILLYRNYLLSETVKNFLKDYNIDIYLHGWEDNLKESKRLIKKFKPLKFKIKKQKKFKIAKLKYNMEKTEP